MNTTGVVMLSPTAVMRRPQGACAIFRVVCCLHAFKRLVGQSVCAGSCAFEASVDCLPLLYENALWLPPGRCVRLCLRHHSP